MIKQTPFKITDFSRNSINGGSINFNLAFKDSKIKIKNTKIEKLIKYEKNLNLHKLKTYKKFFNEQHGIPLENIEVEFFIVRRKVWENSEYPIHRVQLHKPAAGRNKLSKADRMIKEFIDECFTPKG